MDRSGVVAGLMATGVLMLCGCDDPLAGKWETTTKPACDRRAQMTIQDDWDGTAKIPMATDCARDCEVEITVKELDDDSFDFRIKVKTLDVCQVEGGNSTAHYKCEPKKDGEELACGNFFRWRFDEEL